MFIHFLFVLLYIYPSSEFFFTSVLRTKELVDVERRMLMELGKYVEEADLNSEPINDEIRQFYFHSLRENQKARVIPSFIENPLNSFHFIKRMHKEWARLMYLVSCDTCLEDPGLSDLNHELSKIEEQHGINPAALEGDYKGALIGITRLWRTYKLDTFQLIQGLILGELSDPLASEDVHYICTALDNMHDEKKWLEVLLDLQIQNGADKSDKSKTVRAYASVLWKIGQERQALSHLKEQQNDDPSNQHLQADIDFYNPKLDDRDDTDDILQEDTNDDQAVIGHLCRGEGVRDVRILSQLRCIYRRTKIPIYFAKEEVLSIDPRVSIVYQVIYPAEIDDIKQFAANKLADSEVMRPDGSGTVETTVRVSQTTWLRDTDHPTVSRVNSRVQLITGLSTKLGIPMDHAEPLQVLNYGFGGMYVPHLDQVNRTMLPDSDDQRGERMATWMFYLNDVKAGGATVFTDLNITVPVTKGAAAFWYNTKRTGESDHRLTHAGCPVLLGSKWVANKWIRESGQMFRRKCGLDTAAIDGLEDSRTFQ